MFRKEKLNRKSILIPFTQFYHLKSEYINTETVSWNNSIINQHLQTSISSYAKQVFSNWLLH